MQAPRYINAHVAPVRRVIAAFDVPDSFEFYTKRPVEFIKPDSVLAVHTANADVLVEDTLLKHIEKRNIPFKLLQKFDNYPNEVITAQFLTKEQRPQTLNHYYLIQIDNPNGKH